MSASYVSLFPAVRWKTSVPANVRLTALATGYNSVRRNAQLSRWTESRHRGPLYVKHFPAKPPAFQRSEIIGEPASTNVIDRNCFLDRPCSPLIFNNNSLSWACASASPGIDRGSKQRSTSSISRRGREVIRGQSTTRKIVFAFRNATRRSR